MIEFTRKKVLIDTIEKIKDFVAKASRCPFDIEVESTKYRIDAKSIMGLFSLDVSKPVTLCIETNAEDAKEFLSGIAEYLKD